MNSLQRCTIVLIAVAGLPTICLAQEAQTIDSVTIEAARDFIRMSGAVDAILAGTRANIPAQRQALPEIPEEFWVRFENRMTRDAPALADSIAMIYAKTFTLQELRDIVAFFKTPSGRRLVQVQPQLITETSAIGQRWGGRIGEEIVKEMMQ